MHRCGPLRKHYQAVQMNVSISSQYAFFSKSSVVISKLLYEHKFDPLDTWEHLVATDKINCGNGEMGLEYFLEKNVTYVLVVATRVDYAVGSFSIVIIGEGKVSFMRRSEYENDSQLPLSDRRRQDVHPSFLVFA
jgi:hypothetical protein